MSVLKEVAVDGVATISTRRLAERIGRARGTAQASLQRLQTGGHIGHYRTGKGIAMGRYRVPTDRTKNLHKSRTRIQATQGHFQDVRDLFRTSDMYGAGLLFEVAPKEVPMTVVEVVGLGVTSSRGGVVAQLKRLGELPFPLATSGPDPAHKQRKLWTFHELTAGAELINLEALDSREPRYRPRYRMDQEHKHLIEQEQNRERLGLEPYPVIADRDILPFVEKHSRTGCMVFLGPTNGSSYGTVHPEWMGIGAHRVVWVVERGPVPAGHELHHMCGVRRCVNVDHIQVLTRAQHEEVHHGEQPPPDVIASL